jgi:tetratricopeptide (TPR) repeat protein
MVGDAAEELLRQFCRDLRQLWQQAGGPSLRVLSGRIGLGKSQLGAILGGEVRRMPDWEVVRGLIESFQEHARERGRLQLVTMRMGVEEFWRPRYSAVESALRLADPVGKAVGDSGSDGRVAVDGAPPTERAVPRQLPAAVRSFAGRSAELAALAASVDDPGGGTVVISSIHGMAGVGKTTLAVRWAHQVADRFPDGQLFVNLRGFDPTGQAMGPAEAIRAFLDALQVPPQRIPSGLEAQTGLYRSLLSGRRMLILLDNARDSAQIRPLLPGSPGCLVLVTSRHQLTGLVATDDAHSLTLDLLPAGEARQLLARRLGTERVATEAAAASEIIARCAGLPLALAIVAARAAIHPGFSLAALVRRLREGLDGLATGEPTADVRAVFSWSYHALGPAAARLFRLLAIHPGPDIATPAAASLAGVPVGEVQPLLTELTRAHLVNQHAPGRYSLHDLLRAYAGELTDTTDGRHERAAALDRVVDHYLHTAHAADRRLNPHRVTITLDPPPATVTPERFADHEPTLAWLTAEHPVLVGCVTRGIGAGLDAKAWQLVWSIERFLEWHGHWHDEATVHAAALAAASRLGDLRMQAHSHRSVGAAYTRLGRLNEAYHHHEHARKLSHEVGDHLAEARTLHSLGLLVSSQHRHREALSHHQEALALFRKTGFRPGEAQSLNAIGWSQALLGEYRQALRDCQQALTIFAELGDHHAEGMVWDSAGYAHHQLGDYQRAAECYKRALALDRKFGDRYHEADTLVHLGDTCHAVGDGRRARDAWRQAVTILDELGHPDADQVRAKLADQAGGSASR